MLTVTKDVSPVFSYPPERLGALSDLLFFDIETTGFSARRNRLYLIGCLYPKREENLGLDVGLRDDELDQVGQLEIAMASPDFRGYHMHSRMCSVCVDLFKQDGRTRFILSTVSPRTGKGRVAESGQGRSYEAGAGSVSSASQMRSASFS